MFAIANSNLMFKFAIKINLEQNSIIVLSKIEESSYSEGFETFLQVDVVVCSLPIETIKHIEAFKSRQGVQTSVTFLEDSCPVQVQKYIIQAMDAELALDYVNLFVRIVEVRAQEYFIVCRSKFTIQANELQAYFVIQDHYGTNCKCWVCGR